MEPLNPDRIGNDSLISALTDGDGLSLEQQLVVDRMNEIWGWLKQYPKTVVREMIQARHQVNRANSYRWIKKAEDFFGNYESVNVEAERVKQLAWCEMIITDDCATPASKLKAIKLHAEISGTTRDQGSDPIPELPIPLFAFTSDPSVLNISAAGVEEVPYDEIPQNLPEPKAESLRRIGEDG